MIYRELERWVDGREWLRRNRAALLHPPPLANHDSAVRLLVEFGEIESALSDLLMPSADTLLPETRALRHLALRTGHLLRASWRAVPPPAEQLAGSWSMVEETLAGVASPLRVRIPEGFALYGLYPETYLEAAARFSRATPPGEAFCIGLRTIGAPLSAVVGAALERAGWRVHALTLRPRGDPFARAPVLAPELEHLLRQHSGAHALIIDEGPGLSGSSFAGTAEALRRLGFPDDRIVFFPSWNPAAERLCSPAAQQRWPRHARWLGDFDATWIAPGRLSGRPLQLHDGGRWRALFFAPERFPPTQPQHERRKYLSVERSPRLFKFAGLGPYGEAAYRRAVLLADRGFTPPVHALRHGFLVHPFVTGRPLTRRDCTASLIERAAAYLAFLQQTFPATRRTSAHELEQMIAANTRGVRGVTLPERWDRGLFEAGPAVQLDARMQPWEWLATPDGYLKTDALDHHADHFFPGCTDIAWDLAGFTLEFGLDAGGTELLLRRFVHHSGDSGIAARLAPFRVAYAAFAIGYARRAMQATAGSPEAERFRRRAAHFRRELRRALHAPTPP